MMISSSSVSGLFYLPYFFSRYIIIRMGRVRSFIKYIHAGIFSQRVPLEKRVIYAMVVCAMGGELFGFIESFLIGLPLLAIILPFLSFLLLIGLSIWGFKTKNTKLFGLLSISISSLIIFPLMFFANAGLDGGMPYYFLISSVCIALVLSGKTRIILFLINILEYTGLFIIYHLRPEVFLPMSAASSFIDKTSSMIISFSVLFFFAYTVSLQNHHDRAKIQQLSQLYEKQANTDELTTLYNRRYFNNFLKLAILTLGDTGKLHVAMFDIDDFKYVNDKFGHPFGDRILKLFANVLIAIGDDNGCTVCRYGGEEFLLLIPKKDRNEAIEIVENILDYTRNNIRVTDERCITVSAGLLTCKADMDYETLLQEVDKKLYTAKCTGKNRVVY